MMEPPFNLPIDLTQLARKKHATIDFECLQTKGTKL